MHGEQVRSTDQPHIHSLVTVEGMTADKEWKKQYLCSTKLEETYRNLVTKKLITGLSSGQLKPPTTQEECISLVEKLAAREWRIFQSELYANGNGVIRYLAKHIKGMAVEERDIRRVTDEYIEIASASNGKQSQTRLTPQEFVIRYLNHIPPKGLVMVRNLGLYSTRHIKETAELKKQLAQEKGIAVVEKKPEAKKIQCPVCGKELELTNRFNSHELKRYVKQYLAVLGHSPPEHRKIYEKSTIAA